jgi:hypothetical protein
MFVESTRRQGPVWLLAHSMGYLPVLLPKRLLLRVLRWLRLRRNSYRDPTIGLPQPVLRRLNRNQLAGN